MGSSLPGPRARGHGAPPSAGTVDYESMSGTEALMLLANTLAAGDAPARRTAIHELGDRESAGR